MSRTWVNVELGDEALLYIADNNRLVDTQVLVGEIQHSMDAAVLHIICPSHKHRPDFPRYMPCN